ncbi:MAG TPA: hypothetical protein PKA63_05030 [Oligoflexia bacterium]|nr:hypothetical protein [Oligoflexia bacterium]HMP48013.1 hypothetical protein [Oligoflexia bacterium]
MLISNILKPSYSISLWSYVNQLRQGFVFQPYIKILILLTFGLFACTPALPLSQEKPEEFSVFISQAEESLKLSETQLIKAEKTLEESRALLEEARRLHEKMLVLKGQKESELKKIKAEKSAWERRRRQLAEEAEQAKVIEEQKKAAEVSPTPARAPYSASDAPFQ